MGLRERHIQGIDILRRRGGVGFLLSKSDEKKIDAARLDVRSLSQTIQKGSRVVAAGLGAAAVGLVALAFSKRRR